jgi:hypothetical protein
MVRVLGLISELLLMTGCVGPLVPVTQVGETTAVELNETIPVFDARETPTKATVLGCPYRKSNPGILMVQSAQDRAADNPSGLFGGARYRRVLVQ